MKMKTVMVAAIALGLMSAGARPVAKVGEAEYETLDEAIAAGGEIRLVADATVEWLQIGSGVTVTLDLAGHALAGTRSDRATIFVNGGSLTIDDSVGGGRITHNGEVINNGHVASEATAVSICNYGEFVLLNGVICDCVGDGSTIKNRGKFYMSGGAISNCTGTVCGGVQNHGDFVFAGGAIVDCRGQYGAIANNGAFNNVPATMLMTGGLIARCYGTDEGPTVYSAYAMMIEDGIFGDCGEKMVFGNRAGSVVITGGRFAGGVFAQGSGRGFVQVSGGLFTQSAYEMTDFRNVLVLGCTCVANTDDLTAADYPWRVERVFEPLAPGDVAKGIVAAASSAACEKVHVNLTDRDAKRYGQEKLIRKVAVRNADGTWDVSLDVDTSADGYVEVSVATAALAGQLAAVPAAEPGTPLRFVLPASTLTKGLYYRIEECMDVGSPWKMLDCQLATGKDQSYPLYGLDCKARFFRVCQSLTKINWE